jgi:hypothetical protein
MAAVVAIESLHHSTTFFDDRPPLWFKFHSPLRPPPVPRASYLFRRCGAQTSGCNALRFHTMQ